MGQRTQRQQKEVQHPNPLLQTLVIKIEKKTLTKACLHLCRHEWNSLQKLLSFCLPYVAGPCLSTLIQAMAFQRGFKNYSRAREATDSVVVPLPLTSCQLQPSLFSFRQMHFVSKHSE